MTAPMSARDLRSWAADAASALGRLGVTATHGAGPDLAQRGSSWVSLSSSRGSGRLVRAADGSTRCTAHRHADGASLVDTQAATTTREQLDTLVRSLANRSPANA